MPSPAATVSRRTPTRRDRQNSRGEATREVILVTAERLFAQRGIDAVPLRDIGAAAGQRNNVAVQYHFGDRETLVRAVTAFRGAFVDEIRDELAVVRAAADATDTLAFVRTFIVALARNVEDDNYFLPFMSRYLSERGGYEGLIETVDPEIVSSLGSMLRQTLPHLPEVVIAERWQVLWAAAVHTLGRYQQALGTGALPAPLDELVDDLVQFLTAGLEAPLPKGG